MRQSEGLRIDIANLYGSAFDSGQVRIYSGSMPASPGAAATGTLLATITLPADAFAAAVSPGTVQKQGTWEQAAADGTGDAGYARFLASGDDGTSTDATKKRIDVTVGAQGSGADLELQQATAGIVAGQKVTVASFSIAVPQGS